MKKILVFLENLLGTFFDTNKEVDYLWLPWTWLGLLWAAGVFLWGKFLNWGSIPFEFLDWAEITGARLAFLQNAVQQGILPLHMQDATALHGVSDRFMAIPDVLLSPQILLMKFMQLGPFVLLNVILMFSLGLVGLWLIKKRCSLSL
nr:hypothetical protein [Anaerolineaceae bacterium]